MAMAIRTLIGKLMTIEGQVGPTHPVDLLVDGQEVESWDVVLASVPPGHPSCEIVATTETVVLTQDTVTKLPLGTFG